MKNFKIDLFDEKELKNKYDNSIVEESLTYKNTEELIFNLFNSTSKCINISYDFYFHDYEIISDKYDGNMRNDTHFKHMYISENGETFSESKLFSMQNLYEDSGIEFGDYKELSFFLDDGNNSCISKKHLKIYLDKLSENLYTKLTNLGLEVVSFSGIQDTDELGLELGIYKKIHFTCIFNKNSFIEKAQNYINQKINTRTFTIEKREELLLEKIYENNRTYGRKGKSISISGTQVTFHLILLLLHIKKLISINDYNTRQNTLYVDIINNDLTEDQYYNQSIKWFNEIKYETKIIYENNGNISFNNVTFQLTKLNSLEKNGIILLFSILKSENVRDMDYHLEKLIEYKKDLFFSYVRQTNIKMKTFIDFPGRWNKLARENGIGIFIQKSGQYLEITPIHPDGRDFQVDLGY